MVAKLVSVADFAIRAGLGDVDALADEVTAKARASIEAATLHLISIIRTEFDQNVSITDQYYVDVGEFPFVGEFPRIYLSQGFVTTAVASLVIKNADQLGDLAAATAINNAFVVLDQSKGTVLITGTDQALSGTLQIVSGNRYFLSVTYAAGFTAVADMFGTIYENTPDWLKEAAQIIAKAIFDSGVPCDDKDKNALGCCISIEGLANRYIRYLPSALKPIS
jgi:hypothetical protein